MLCAVEIANKFIYSIYLRIDVRHFWKTLYTFGYNIWYSAAAW